MDPNNFQAVSQVDPSSLPAGFSVNDPNQTPQQAAQKLQQDEQASNILSQALSPDALARLKRIKLVKPDKIAAIEKAIVHMALNGKLAAPMSEGKLIELLERSNHSKAQQSKSSSGIHIQRKKYSLDSDESDDDDV